jgi:adenine-specific DNA-methyltransferase
MTGRAIVPAPPDVSEVSEHLTERHLAAIAVALGAQTVAGWSPAEEALTRNLPSIPGATLRAIHSGVDEGRDPLGAAFCRARSPETRRPQGATYTPLPIVRAMLQWAAGCVPAPVRVIDPGAGSARFLVEAGQQFPDAQLLGVEIDPLAAMLARAHLVCVGLAGRARIVVQDYRDVSLPRVSGRTLYVGNPPYVRHHLIAPERKAWLTKTAGALDLPDVSQLAGLHVHFYLATAAGASRGDAGAFITSAEWLDVNYGRVLRDLFTGPLGGRSITLIEPTAKPFRDAATTAAIATFEIGSEPKSVRIKRVATLDELRDAGLEAGRPIRLERLAAASRWTPLTRLAKPEREGFVELGELCRVHRGQVTGSNKVWIAGAHSMGLPASFLFATVTRARELFAAGAALRDAAALRRVIDLPGELDLLDAAERKAVEAFLRKARALGADQGYIARNRKAWWSVGLRRAAPILTTYMARRPPAFVRNLAGARHINIAHGIYPREAMSGEMLDALAAYLSRTVTQAEGRTYAGGLTKFEPKEVERLLVPEPSALLQRSLALPSA